MSDLKISEAGTVQFPMVKHAAEIGWILLKPEVAKQKRGGEAGMLLRDELEAKLSEFNPWLVEQGVVQGDIGRLSKSVTFDVKTLEALRTEKGSDEGKVFNLVLGLQKQSTTTPMLRRFFNL